MKKLLGSIGLMGFLTLSALHAAATPPAEPPGQGDCGHGNSGQTCVPDPQPTNGQDCLEHGNNGGVNEDHCLGDTTTTVPTTTTVTETTVTSTTVTTVPEDPPSSTTTTESPTVSETPTETVTTVPTPTEVTTAPPAESPAPPTTTAGPTVSQPGTGTESPKKPTKPETAKTGQLAFTGVEDVVPLAAGALTLLSVGSGLLWLGQKRRR